MLLFSYPSAQLYLAIAELSLAIAKLIFNLIFVFGVFADVAEVNAVGVHEFVLFVSVIVPGFGLLFPGNIWACRETPGDKPSDEGDAQAHGKSQGLESNMVP